MILSIEQARQRPARRRVYQLAKELGVQSKRIVEYCNRQGMTQIENHMSLVSPDDADRIRTAIVNNEDDVL